MFSWTCTWIIYFEQNNRILRQNTTHALFGSNPLAGRIHLLFSMVNELLKIKASVFWWKISPTVYGQPPPNLKLPFIGKFCDFIKMPDLESSLLLERGEKILVTVYSSFKQPKMLIFTWHMFDSFPSFCLQSRNSIILSWTFWTSLFSSLASCLASFVRSGLYSRFLLSTISQEYWTTPYLWPGRGIVTFNPL